MLLFAVNVPVVHAGADGPRYGDFHFSHASILIHNIFIGACARKLFLSRGNTDQKMNLKKMNLKKKTNLKKD